LKTTHRKRAPSCFKKQPAEKNLFLSLYRSFFLKALKKSLKRKNVLSKILSDPNFLVLCWTRFFSWEEKNSVACRNLRGFFSWFKSLGNFVRNNKKSFFCYFEQKKKARTINRKQDGSFVKKLSAVAFSKKKILEEGILLVLEQVCRFSSLQHSFYRKVFRIKKKTFQKASWFIKGSTTALLLSKLNFFVVTYIKNRVDDSFFLALLKQEVKRFKTSWKKSLSLFTSLFFQYFDRAFMKGLAPFFSSGAFYNNKDLRCSFSKSVLKRKKAAYYFRFKEFFFLESL
jgi:hypothetical protein